MTARSIVPLGHPQHEAIRAEVASARELADELNVSVEDVLAQQLVQYKAALGETRLALAKAYSRYWA